MVTPAGASMVSVVGMSVSSFGLFDCVCSPSGSDTFSARRTVPPAAAPDRSASGVNVGFRTADLRVRHGRGQQEDGKEDDGFLHK